MVSYISCLPYAQSLIPIEAILSIVGGGLCCMSSFPYVWDANGAPKGDARFYLALFGQAITGIACPFVSSVPTKVDNKIVEKFGLNTICL